MASSKDIGSSSSSSNLKKKSSFNLICDNIDSATPLQCKGTEIVALQREDSLQGCKKSFTEDAPAHYKCKIKPFSSYSKLERFNLPMFEEGGYKWNLALYPNGNKGEKGIGYLSLYLVLTDTGNLPPAWEVKTIFRLYVFNHMHGKYLMIEGNHERRFNGIKTEWGFPRLMSLKTFKDRTNGYLVDDTCVIGAEVFTILNSGRCDTVSLRTQPTPYKHVCMVHDFSKLKQGKLLSSEEFTVGGYKWIIGLMKSNYASIYLILSDTTSLSPGQQVCVDFGLCIKNQILDNGGYATEQRWFSASQSCWGFDKYMLLSRMKDKRRGYLVGDTCVLGAKISIRGVINANKN